MTLGKPEKMKASTDVTVWAIGRLADRIDKLKLCSHDYEEDIGNLIRRFVGLKEKL